MGQDIKGLEEQREQIRAQIAATGPLRVGSLFHRYRRCGKPSCRCADLASPGHGCWVVVKRRGRGTVTTTVPESALEEVRGQLEAGRRFGALCKEFAEVSDELCGALLARREATSREAAKKGGSRGISKRRSEAK